MTSSVHHFHGAGQISNVNSSNDGVMVTQTTTVVLPAEALRSAADTPADGLVHLLQPNARFTGRQRELAALREALTAERPGPGAATVVVHGLGGVGKSTLALQYAQSFRTAYDLVWWIDASSPGGVEEALTGIARRLSPAWAGTARPPELAAWALAWLQHHTGWLLVYDDVEDPALLEPFLGSLTRGHHLVTTRLADDWDTLGAASDGALLALDVLPHEQATELLWSWVAEWDGSDGSRWEAGQLARELGGLPLALEQAGAYLRRTRTTVAGYRRRLGLRPSGAPTRRDPQRTVARVWQVTLAAVAGDDPVAADLLHALAWLDADGCPRDLVSRLAPDELAADDALGVLHAYSMIGYAWRDVRVHRLVQGALRAEALAARPPGGAPRGRREAERAVLAAVHPAGREQERDTAELTRLAGQVRALAATDPGDDSDPAVFTLYAATALLLEAEGQSVRALPLYEAYDAQIRHGFGPDHEFALVAGSALARVHLATGRPEQALGLLEPLLERSLRVHGPGHLTTLNIRSGLADAHQACGRAERAVEEYERAAADSRDALGPDHPRTFSLLSDLAGAHGSLGRADQAIAIYEGLLGREAAVTGDEHLPPGMLRINALRLRNNLAGAYENVGRYRRAVALYQEALAGLEELCGPEHPDTLSCLSNLGYAHESAGDLEPAGRIYRDVLARRAAALGEEHPDTLLSRSNLAYLCLTTGDVGTGLDLCRTVLAQRTGVLGPESPDTLVSLSMLASAHAAAGEPELALPLFEQTLRLRLEVLGPDHPDTLRSRGNLAAVHHRLGDHRRAVLRFEEVLAAQERLLGPESRDTVLSRNNLASACRAAGDLERARSLITTVLEQRTRLLGPDHPDTLGSRATLARVDEASGDLDRAVEGYRAALAGLTGAVGPDHPTAALVADLLAAALRTRDAPGTRP
ncbi:FxSxx-COOH system tetratricopeptide repeat protein [Kitasatospora sp. NPDC057518]|uniref:FxSxx-COOH system tetratricopeptide repeat protein n=1 Tax=Kitasatospora sp. NPDC057518 TaxID=3346155 RepID=UPI0036BECFE2